MELKKRIMIVSDTHRHLDNLKLALARELPIDGLIHCGDVEGQEKDIARLAGCPVYIVRGNNDFFYRSSKRERRVPFWQKNYDYTRT